MAKDTQLAEYIVAQDKRIVELRAALEQAQGRERSEMATEVQTEIKDRVMAQRAKRRNTVARVITDFLHDYDALKTMVDANEAALEQAQERERVLRERLQTLHDEADDVNAQWGLKDFLCLMCNSDGWDAIVGVKHQPDCALLLARAALQETGE